MTLDERKRAILESIIRDYVESAEPVGSRAIVKKHGLKISAATVRNEMADLEEMGYLEQPHTSAGRIPSEKGYRYYVDCIMEKEKPGEEELMVLQRLLGERVRDWQSVVQKIGQFMAQMTSLASFVILPAVRFNQITSLQMLPLNDSQALLLVVTDTGLVMHRTIEVPPAIKAADLQHLGEILTQTLKGKTLASLNQGELRSLRDELKRRRHVIDRALEAIDEFTDDYGDERVLISGIMNMLNEPEFKDMDTLKRVFRLLEEDRQLKYLIPEQVGQEVSIRIGRENQEEAIHDMSLVYTGYRTGKEEGKLGLIGPVRMEYWKAAGSLESFQVLIEEIMKKYFS